MKQLDLEQCIFERRILEAWDAGACAEMIARSECRPEVRILHDLNIALNARAPARAEGGGNGVHADLS